MELKYKLLTNTSKPPIQSTPEAAGYDLFLNSIKYVSEYKYWELGSGIAFEIPENHVGLLVPRSSISNTPYTMVNSIGIIDSDYRGEIKTRFLFNPLKNIENQYKIGDKFIQLVIIPLPKLTLMKVDNLTETQRNEQGFGSTGK